MTHRNKSQNMGLLMIVVLSAVFLWALTAVLWPVPVVYAEGPEIITLTVTSSLETYFYDPGLDPTGGTVYFNNLIGEGGGQVITVTTTVSGSMPITLTGATAFGMTPISDTNSTGELGITYTIGTSAGTENGVLFTVTDSDGFTDTALITFTQDITDPLVEFDDVTNPDYDSVGDELDDDGSNWYDPDHLSAGWYFTSTVTDTLSDPALANASWDHSNDAYDQLTYDPGLDGDGVFSGVSDDGDGVVTVTLTITDNVGNSASDLVVFNLDNTDPTITSPTITEGSAYLHANGLTVYYGDKMGTASQAFTVQGNAQDSGVGLHYVSYSAALNQGYSTDYLHLEAWYRDYTANQSHTTSGVITATVYDRLGNFATQTFTYTRDITSPDISYGSPPIVENSPHDALYADGTTVYYSDQMGGTAQSFTVRGDATDNGGGAGLWRATFSSPHLNDPGDDLTFPDWSGIYYVDSSESGSGTITVKVYDNVSNWSQRTFDYVEDTTAPTVVLTDVTDPGYDENTNELDTDGSNWYNAGDFTAGGGGGWAFTSDTNDDGAGLASGTAAWDHSNNDFDRPIRDCGPDGDGIFLDASGDGEGTVTVTVTITDNVGNSASDTVVFNIDNTEPTITSPYISEDSDYLYRADDLITIYYGNMALATFTVHGSSQDNTGVGLDRAEFSDAFGAAPSDDDTPDDWAGTYYPNNSQNWGDGTIYVTVYDLLDNAASQTFDYFQDTEPPEVDVTCPPSSSVPSWSVSWSGSDPSPPSGLKHFDVQYWVESDGWQDWHTGTLLKQDTFGPDSPIPVQDNTTYCFKVRGEDNVSNVSSWTTGEDCTTYSSGIKRAFLPILWAPDPNWGFETGDFTNWQQHGGELAQSVSTAEHHSGNYSARLGRPGYDCEGGVPIGSAWLRRSVTVPSSGSPTLSFWYKIFSQDKNSALSDQYDLFAVYVNGSQLWKDANTNDPYGCDTLRELPWRSGTVSLTDYKGESIQIAFYAYNRPDGWYNTYVYVDDVSVE
jgi:hypothetical protein